MYFSILLGTWCWYGFDNYNQSFDISIFLDTICYIPKTVLYFIQKVLPADREKFEKDVRKLIIGKPYTGHVYHDIFTISNKDLDEGEIKKLKKVIEKLTKERNDYVPLLWFKIKEDLKKTEKKWLNWEQVKKIAADGDLHNEQTLQAALQFFHGAGDIVYFSDIKEFIVLDLQWLINQLSEVITIPTHRELQKKQVDTRHWKKLETNSILHEDICKAVWPEGTFEGLVAIMMKYALLLPLPIKPNKGKAYLVPSLLPLKSQDGEHEVKQSEESLRLPVRMVPAHEFIPVGLTSRLITTLINEHHWEAMGDLYKDFAALNVDKSGKGPQISITQVEDTIEIRCTKRWEGAEKHLQESLKTIKSTFETLTNKQTSKLQLQCQECQEWFGVEEPSADCPLCNHTFDQSTYSIWVEVSFCVG